MDVVTPCERFTVCRLASKSGRSKLALIVSPDEMNRHLPTFLASPLTTRLRAWPTRVPLRFAGKEGEIALERIYTLDQEAIDSVLGRIPPRTARRVADILTEMFAL